MAENEPGAVLEAQRETGENIATDPDPKPAATPTDDDDPASHAVEHGGKKMVPLDELQKEREKRQEAQAKAEEAGKYRQWAEQVSGLLQQHPEALAILQGKAAPAPPAEPQPADDETELYQTFAKSMDLFDAQGQPDVGRAKALMAIIDARSEKRAKQLVEEQVGPIASRTAKDKSQINLQRMSALKAKNGTQINPKYLQAVWQLVPEDFSAQDEVAQVLGLAAMGYQNLVDAPTSTTEPAESEPLMTEPTGPGRLSITHLQQKAAKEMGVSTSDFAKGIKSVEDRGGQLE